MKWNTITRLMKISQLIILCLLIMAPLDSYAKKAEKPSNRAVEHNNLGVTALSNNEIDKAIFEFKTAAELNPLYVEAWSNLGFAYKFKGRLDDAVAMIKKAIALDKKFATPYNQLGVVYFEQGKHKEALEQFKLAKKYNTKLSDAWYNGGLVYLDLYKKGKKPEDLDNAVKEFSGCTAINPDHQQAHLYLANVYQIQQKYYEAITRYRLALEVDPTLCDAWNNLAELYTKTGETLKAQEALNRSLECSPDSTEAHVNLGLNFLKDENYRMALAEFNKAIKLDTNNEVAYFNVGYALYKLATSDQNPASVALVLGESNRAYESALKLRPTYAEAAFNIAYNYQHLKDFSNAALWYEKAIAIDATYYRSYYSLGSTRQALGQTREAAKAYCDFVKSGAEKDESLKSDVETAKNLIKSLGGCN